MQSWRATKLPVYDYFCPANGRTVEVAHDAAVTIRTWGEVCYLAQMQPENTDPGAAVRRVIRSAPAVAISESNQELRNQGFTKLVKREEGVYENVTAVEGESRYMVRGRKETVPHVHKKVGD